MGDLPRAPARPRRVSAACHARLGSHPLAARPPRAASRPPTSERSAPRTTGERADEAAASTAPPPTPGAGPPSSGSRRSASSTTGSTGCASGGRRPSRSARAGTPHSPPRPVGPRAEHHAEDQGEGGVRAAGRDLQAVPARAEPGNEARPRGDLQRHPVEHLLGGGRGGVVVVGQRQRPQGLAHEERPVEIDPAHQPREPALSQPQPIRLGRRPHLRPVPSRSQNVFRNAWTRPRRPGAGWRPAGWGRGRSGPRVQLDDNRPRCLRWLGGAHLPPLRLHRGLDPRAVHALRAVRARPRPAAAGPPPDDGHLGRRGGRPRPPRRRRRDRPEREVRPRRPPARRRRPRGRRRTRPPHEARRRTAGPAGLRPAADATDRSASPPAPRS